jgi:hypothetical protein
VLHGVLDLVQYHQRVAQSCERLADLVDQRVARQLEPERLGHLACDSVAIGHLGQVAPPHAAGIIREVYGREAPTLPYDSLRIFVIF